MQQMLVALSLIAAGLIRPDPIIKTSLYHLSCDKKVKMTVKRVIERYGSDTAGKNIKIKQQNDGVKREDVKSQERKITHCPTLF